MLRLAPLLLAALCAACGPVSPRDGDAGAGVDSGGERDAGPAADAGPRADAGPIVTLDASLDAGPVVTPDGGPPPASGPILYPFGARHSPITAEHVAQLAVVAARGPSLDDGALMKVGDSITVSAAFLQCFSGSYDLGGRPLEATRAHYDGWYARQSEAATVGWSASSAIAGSPSPLEREHAATQARVATVMFGTNDSGFRAPQTFLRDMWTIVDFLLARGTVPLLTSVPPRDDNASADATAQLYSLGVRALAQGRGVPFVDLHAALLPLPDHGLAGDGVHLRSGPGGGCALTDPGLAGGSNQRNLLTLEQLDRARAALGGAALDADAPRLAGEGTVADPFVVESLPFVAFGDTTGGARALTAYACSTANEGGPEHVYRFTLAAPATVRALTLAAPGGPDIDVHLLSGAASPGACAARGDTDASAALPAGTHYVVADSWVNGSGEERAGEYVLLLRVEG